MKKQTINPEGTIPLAEALRKARILKWPWTLIRGAVVTGAIPSWRSSKKKGARYYTKWSDIEAFIKGLQNGIYS